MKQNKHNRIHTENSGNYTSVLEPLLQYGSENAVSTKTLMSMLDLSERELRELVDLERRKGILICSNASPTGGYFLPRTREELQAFYKVLGQKATSILQALRNTKRALDEMDGRQVLSVREEKEYEE